MVILDCLILDSDKDVNDGWKFMTNSSQSMEILSFELGTHFPNPTLQHDLGEAI